MYLPRHSENSRVLSNDRTDNFLLIIIHTKFHLVQNHRERKLKSRLLSEI